MKQFFIYWVWPQPGGWNYSDPKIIAFIGISLGFILLSYALRMWRSNLANQQTKTLSARWPTASFWFGIVALFLIVCRVELIQYLAMRALWAIWFGSAALFVLVQVLQFRRRHYTVIGRAQILDERDKYLPRKK